MMKTMLGGRCCAARTLAWLGTYRHRIMSHSKERIILRIWPPEKMSDKLSELVGVSAIRPIESFRQALTACRTTHAVFSSFQGGALAACTTPQKMCSGL